MSMALSNGDCLVPYYDLVINGERVSDYYKQFITQVEFEDSDCEAGLVRVSINDRDFEFSKHFEFNKGVKLSLTMGFEKKNRLMMVGEITHFEASFDENGVQNLIIGAIDKSNSMNSTKKVRSWKDIKRSDVVSAIANEYGFVAVVQDSGEIHEQISQENETDAQFIKKLADDEAFEFYVFPEQKKLYFGDKFNDLKVKDTLYYKSGDCTIRSFSPSLVERNKKESVGKDGHGSKDKSQKSGKDIGTSSGEITGGTSGGTSGGVNIDVQVEDGDAEGIDIVGLTGAQK